MKYQSFVANWISKAQLPESEQGSDLAVLIMLIALEENMRNQEAVARKYENNLRQKGLLHSVPSRSASGNGHKMGHLLKPSGTSMATFQMGCVSRTERPRWHLQSNSRDTTRELGQKLSPPTAT